MTSVESQIWGRLPKFSGKNFQGWKRQVVVILKSKDLLLCLDAKEKRPYTDVKTSHEETQRAPVEAVDQGESESKETLTQGLLFSALDDKIIDQVQTCKTAAEIWKRLLLIYENASETNVDRLLQEYYSYQKVPQENMATHISRVEAMADQLGELGEPQSERSVVSKLLNSLPSDYDSLRNAWDATHPEFRTKDELITRLMKQEVKAKPAPRDAAREVAFYAKGKGDKVKKYGRSREIKCYNCNELGHIARNCRKPKRQNDNRDTRHDNISQDRNYPAHGASKNLALTLHQREGLKSEIWIVDSGASRHVSPNREYFSTYEPWQESLQVADNKWISSIGRGNVEVRCQVGRKSVKLTLKDVLHMPGVIHNLFSVNQAIKNGAQVNFVDWGCKILVNRDVVAIGESRSGVPILKATTVLNTALIVQTKRSLQEWHKSLGHADQQVINEMATSGCVEGLEIVKPQESNCEICPAGKGTRAPHTTESTFKPVEVGQRIDMDLVGPLPEPSLGNAKYALLMMDKFSGYSFAYFIRTKDETYDKLQLFLTTFENESGQRAKSVLTDNGSEFINENVKRLFAVEHVDLFTSAPRTPEQNGTAERNNRVIIETVRTLLAQSDLPSSLWAEAASTAVYLRNRVPKKGLKITPYEIFVGRKPNVSHIVPFGTRVHSLINDRRLGKFDPKTEPGFVIGFTPRMNTYRVYIPLRNIVKTSSDVIFRNHHLFEKEFTVGSDVNQAGTSQIPIEVTSSRDPLAGSVKNKPQSNNLLNKFFNDLEKDIGIESTRFVDARSDISSITRPSYSIITDKGTISRENESLSKDCHEQPADANEKQSSLGEPPEFNEHISRSSIDSCDVHSQPPLLDPHGSLLSTLLLMANEAPGSEEPETYKEATTGPNHAQWKQAIDSEKLAHDINKTWKIVKRPKQGTTLTAKWIFKVKRDAAGRTKRFKARLVVRGYKQRQGIDYIETFAPVARMDSIRVLLAIAAAKDLAIEKFDVSTAFLNGDITDDIYVEPPEGVETKSGECLKLQKALYGLKQAPRVWNSKFDETIRKLKFEPLKCDPCIYLNEADDIYLGIYVDDGIVVGMSQEKCRNVINLLNQVFSVNHVQDNTFLGMEIVKTNNGIFLCQRRYIQDILSRFKMDQSKAKSSPLNDVKSLFVSESDTVTDVPYRAAIGSLLYCAMLTRPDLLYPTVLLSRFCTAPEKKHWTAIKDLFRYLKGTVNIGLFYRKAREQQLIVDVYTDADWAGDAETRKSTSGLIITLSGSPIIFASRQQPVVALSSTEAEYVAACEATKELVWLRSLLSELKVAFNKPLMHIDNRSTIRMIKNHEMQRRTKHIDIKFHYVRDQYHDSTFELSPVDTQDQLADYLTKSLSGPQLKRLLDMSMVIDKAGSEMSQGTTLD